MKDGRKKIFVLGSAGMLGNDMVRTLVPAYTVVAKDIDAIDITDTHQVADTLNATKPDVVVNCAAYTDVDASETHRETAFAVNAEGVRNVARCCAKVGARLVHISTDYVFDGTKKEPYTENDTPHPLNVYGESKLAGEEYIRAVFNNYVIVRTSWLFGKNGKNFVKTMLALAEKQTEISVVNDQRGAPTFTGHLAAGIERIITSEETGIFNITNSGTCSWFEFAQSIFENAGLNHIRVVSITSEELKRPAPRPKNSVLDGSKFFDRTGYRMPLWQIGLKEYLGM